MTSKVVFSRLASKQLRAVPHYIAEKLLKWAYDVEVFGIDAVRKHPGFHDEPLKGKRTGVRSIRLNKQWRAIYRQRIDRTIWIYILEVTPHDYKI